MSRNFTKQYEKFGDEDFTIYDGEPDEDWVTTNEDAYYAKGGDVFLDGFDVNHLNAIVDDAIETFSREDEREKQKAIALQHSKDLDKNMSDEEYQKFLIDQHRERHRYLLFQTVLDEFHNYVPDMIEARTQFYKHIGIPMSKKLIDLDKKPLFYY